MKTITIGRGDGCQIFIDDDMISRRHAILKISTFGSMEIVDMGKNGTFVNGVRLRPNVPVPVKRKDVVSFANVSRLDWKQVPNPGIYYKWGIIGVTALIVLLILINLGLWAFNSINKESDYPMDDSGMPASEQVVPSDSLKDSTNRQDDSSNNNHRDESDNNDRQADSDNNDHQADNQGSYDFGPDKFDQAAKKHREAEAAAKRQREAAKAKQKQQDQQGSNKQQPVKPNSQKQKQKEPSKQQNQKQDAIIM